MKYVEELKPGDIFLSDKKIPYIKTSDHRNSKPIKYLCISIDTGMGSWMEGSSVVNILDLYKRDEDGNILPIKIYKDPKQEFYKN